MSDKGLLSRIYKELSKFNRKTIIQIYKWAKDLNEHYTKYYKMHRWKGSMRKDVQHKTVQIKKTNDTKCWWRCGTTRILTHRCWVCKIVQPLWKTVPRFLKKLYIYQLCHLAILLLGLYSREMKTCMYTKSVQKCSQQLYWHSPEPEATQTSLASGWRHTPWDAREVGLCPAAQVKVPLTHETVWPTESQTRETAHCGSTF